MSAAEPTPETQRSGARPPYRTIRELRGESLADVAPRVGPGMDASALSKIERGLREPGVGTFHRLLRALGEETLANAVAPYVGTNQ